MSDDQAQAGLPPPVYSVQLDTSNVLVSHVASNVPQDGFVTVGADVWARMQALGWRCTYDGATVAAYTPPPAAVQPYLTGSDIIDGMSPAQAKAPDVDPRDLVRIQTAPLAAMVKSKIARVATANGITPDALLAQATPTGGL